MSVFSLYPGVLMSLCVLLSSLSTRLQTLTCLSQVYNYLYPSQQLTAFHVVNHNLLFDLLCKAMILSD